MIKSRTIEILREEVKRAPYILEGIYPDSVIDKIIIDRLVKLEKVTKDKINIFVKVLTRVLEKDLYEIDLQYEVKE